MEVEGAGEITPMPSPSPDDQNYEPVVSEGGDTGGAGTVETPMEEVKTEDTSIAEVINLAEAELAKAEPTADLDVDFFIGEARKSSETQQESAFNTFILQFVTAHDQALRMSRNDSVSLELNLTEAEVQSLVNRFDSG